MPIPVLQAVSYQRTMVSGRTKPCLFLCEDAESGAVGEYVVKLKAGLETGENGLAAELVASQLATVLDMQTPEIAIINVDPLLAEAVSDHSLARKIKESAGLNFGSKVLTGGFDTWPVGKPIPSSLFQDATDIFAFDAMIQNPDRRDDKPNILWKADQLSIIDHEMGFSFVYAIGPQADPWKISSLGWLSKHLFYRHLKGRTISFDRFAGALETISEGIIDGIMSGIPQEWQSDTMGKIQNHIMQISTHANEFIDEVRRTLA